VTQLRENYNNERLTYETAECVHENYWDFINDNESIVTQKSLK